MTGHDLEDWFKAESELLPSMQLRIKETNEALTVEAEPPGFNAKDLEVSLEPRRLTISGKRETNEEQKKGKTTFQEQTLDQLLRVIDLPAEIDGVKTTAMLKGGLLEINLPKVVKPATSRVEVKAA